MQSLRPWQRLNARSFERLNRDIEQSVFVSFETFSAAGWFNPLPKERIIAFLARFPLRQSQFAEAAHD